MMQYTVEMHEIMAELYSALITNGDPDNVRLKIKEFCDHAVEQPDDILSAAFIPIFLNLLSTMEAERESKSRKRKN